MTMAPPDRTVSPLVVRLFGPFEVHVHGLPLPRLRSRKGQWLLALLALRGGGAVERAWLAGTLWPDSREPQAYLNLRTTLKDLRRALGPEAKRLHAPTRHTLALDLAGAAVDVVAFDAAVARGETAALEEAIAHYRGLLLEGCAEEWLFQERAPREAAYLQALETLAARAMRENDPATAQRYLRQVAAVDPLREGSQRTLMQALAAGGSYGAALLTYRELCLLLRRELNAQPAPETTALFQQIRAEAREKAAPTARARCSATHAARGYPGAQPNRGQARPVLFGRAPSTEHRAPSEATFTFLFTDVEGSARLWEEQPDAMRAALARHDTLLRQAIERHGGVVFKTWGDQFCAAFATAPEATAAAVTAQRALQREVWGATGPLRVRMAVHTGAAEEREGDYFGPALNRIARLLQVGHGGQILLSRATQELLCDPLPKGTDLRDLGEHRFRDLTRSEHVFQLLAPELSADFPPLRSLEAFAHNLPAQLTSFIGRRQEMAEVRQFLMTTRLLTVTGTGGCGKSRLVLQVAADLVEQFAHGIWLVELAALSDPALVPQTVAAALGMQEEPGRSLTETLTTCLKPRHLLLVLDNCEHVLSACARLAETLLRGCPGIRILATSREALNIPGETPYRLRSLSLPTDDPRRTTHEADASGVVDPASLVASEAVQLFVDRVTTVVPSFTLTTANAPAVAQICHSLDGIPLAIELAAARAKALPVEQLAPRLDHMFRLLTGVFSRTALPRQQTLRALIDWSYDLLSEPERVLLRRLSVFVGGWTLEAAEAVCAGDGIEDWQILDLLTLLVEKSLVHYEERDGEGRYRLLETVRQYACDRLRADAACGGGAEALHERHLGFFLRLAEAAPEFEGSRHVEGLEYLNREHDNFRAALRWAMGRGDGETALRLAAVIADLRLIQGYLAEAGDVVMKLLPLLEGPGQRAARARALHLARRAPWLQGEFARAAQLLEECLTIQQERGDKAGTAGCYCSLAVLSRFQGDYARARCFGEQSMALYQELGDGRAAVCARYALGYVSYLEGNLATAQAVLEESLVTLRALGDHYHCGWVLLHLGDVANARSDYQTAMAYLEEGLALWRAMDDRDGITSALCQLGQVAKNQGDWQTARSRFAECLRTPPTREVTPHLLWSLAGLAEVAGAQGKPERAARLFGAVEALGETARGFPFLAHDGADHERGTAATRAALGDEVFEAAWTAGRALLLHQAIAEALEEEQMGTRHAERSEARPPGG